MNKKISLIVIIASITLSLNSAKAMLKTELEQSNKASSTDLIREDAFNLSDLDNALKQITNVADKKPIQKKQDSDWLLPLLYAFLDVDPNSSIQTIIQKFNEQQDKILKTICNLSQTTEIDLLSMFQELLETLQQ